MMGRIGDLNLEYRLVFPGLLETALYLLKELLPPATKEQILML
jgi:hypothetical protein